MEAIKRKLPFHNAVVYFDLLEFLFFLEFTDSDFEENSKLSKSARKSKPSKILKDFFYSSLFSNL